VFLLSSLDGSNGFVINGIDSSDYSGHAVSGAGMCVAHCEFIYFCVLCGHI
jgi:hypothetical protein